MLSHSRGTKLRAHGSTSNYGSAHVGLPWVSLLAFLRLVTNPRVFERPEPMADARHQVRAWIACETAWIPQPTERHADLLNELLALPGVHAKRRVRKWVLYHLDRKTSRIL